MKPMTPVGVGYHGAGRWLIRWLCEHGWDMPEERPIGGNWLHFGPGPEDARWIMCPRCYVADYFDRVRHGLHMLALAIERTQQRADER